MKENEAPEKLYLIRNVSRSTSLNTTNDSHDEFLQEWYKGREKDTDIEYIRTDAFIEKACEWLIAQEEIVGISFQQDFIERFKKVMEE